MPWREIIATLNLAGTCWLVYSYWKFQFRIWKLEKELSSTKDTNLLLAETVIKEDQENESVHQVPKQLRAVSYQDY